MPAFQHEALGQEADAIRILRFEKTHPGRKHVSCLLETVSLSSIQHNFIAVSHVWGNDDRTLKILMNGQSYFVTPQLWQFLLLAVERVPDKSLWIDAICINQSNVAEKQTQLPLMGLIFSKAQKLIAWLDSPINVRDSSPTSADPNCTAALAIADDACDIFECLEKEEEIFQALLRLFFHKYWSRVWIVQEIRLSRDKEFWWEGQTISSQRLEIIATAIDARFEQDLPTLNQALWTNLCATTESAKQKGARATLLDHMSSAGEDGRRYFANADETPDLADLVFKHKDFDCSIPLDRVFAFLGLAKGGDQFKVQYDLLPAELLARIWNTSPIRELTLFRDILQALGIELSFPVTARVVDHSWHTELEDVLRSLQELVPDHLREQVLEIRHVKTSIAVDRSRHFTKSFFHSYDNPSRLRVPGSGEISAVGEPNAAYADLIVMIKLIVNDSTSLGSFAMSLPSLGMYFLASENIDRHSLIPRRSKLHGLLKITRTARQSDMEGDQIVVRHVDLNRKIGTRTRQEILKRDPNFEHTMANAVLAFSGCRPGRISISNLTPVKLFNFLRMSDDDHPVWQEAQQWTLSVR
jgi:Heterokaryon incompatibility protein (HET)